MCVLCRRPGRDDSWSPTVVGLAKRDLLRDVLSVFGTCSADMVHVFEDLEADCVRFDVARSKTLTKLALDWQDTLKRASTDEY